MNVTILTTTYGSMHVHATGCADIKRSPQYRRLTQDEQWTMTDITTEKEIVEDVYGPQAGSFYAEAGLEDDDPTAWENYRGEFKIFPCVKGLV